MPFALGSCFRASDTIPSAFTTSRSPAMFSAYDFASLQHPRIRKPGSNVCMVIVFPGIRMDELVMNLGRYVEEAKDMTALELQLERPMYFRIFVIANFPDTCGRNVGPMHGWRASFQQRDISSGRSRLPSPRRRLKGSQVVGAITLIPAATD